MTTIRIRSAQEMLSACEQLWPGMDGLIAAAAVADQRPQHCAPEKVKKSEGPETLVLVRTPDVLATLSGVKRPGQWVVGFAAESEDHVANAQAKLQKKHLDAILVNDISEGKGFGGQDNTLIAVTARGAGAAMGPLPKHKLAQVVTAWLNEALPPAR
jgi:phosphopantothenoylcysteine decarboxylase/phosphopantothenate--cysteine ligase